MPEPARREPQRLWEPALRVLAPAAAALHRKHRAHVVTPRADLWLLDDAFTGNTVVIARPNGSPPPSP